VLGVLLNTRGLVELVVLNTGLELASSRDYVHHDGVMALVTTLDHSIVSA